MNSPRFAHIDKVALLVAATVLNGCASRIGPHSISTERPNYNDVIQDTAKQQTFINLLRVHERQPTLFLDVSEVDVGLELQATGGASVSIPRGRAGTASSGGTAATSVPFFNGHDATISGSIVSEESPTIRYVPLQGQNLVAQISAPISEDSIAALLDSGWPASALFSMTAARLTPIARDYYPALAALSYLYENNALVIVAESGGGSAPSGGGKDSYPFLSITIPESNAAGTPKANDALAIYCIPDELGAMPAQRQDSLKPNDITTTCRALWNRLREIYGLPTITWKDNLASPNDKNSKPYSTGQFRILLRTHSDLNTPADPSSLDASATARAWLSALPALRTRSALGVLRDVTQPDQLDYDLAVFVDANLYENGGTSAKDGKTRVLPLKWMVQHFKEEIGRGAPRDFYVFNSSPYNDEAVDQDINAKDKEDVLSAAANTHGDPKILLEDNTLWQFVKRSSEHEPADDVIPEPPKTWIDDSAQKDFYNTHCQQDFDDNNYYPNRGDKERHYLIIVRQPATAAFPKNAYVSAVFGKYGYYIDGDDLVSQNNFSLISQLVTIQAVAQNQTLTPTIGVGAK
jgi:hypothetical protein